MRRPTIILLAAAKPKRSSRPAIPEFLGPRARRTILKSFARDLTTGVLQTVDTAAGRIVPRSNLLDWLGTELHKAHVVRGDAILRAFGGAK